jgi:hypothetical protein
MSEPLTARELAQILDEIGDISAEIKGLAESFSNGRTFNNDWIIGQMNRLRGLQVRLYSLLDENPMKPVSRAALLKNRQVEDDA